MMSVVSFPNGPMVARSWYFDPISRNNPTNVRVGPPLTTLFGSAHVHSVDPYQVAWLLVKPADLGLPYRIQQGMCIVSLLCSIFKT